MIKPKCFGTKEYSKKSAICNSCSHYLGCGVVREERKNKYLTRH